jgi:hypothetical protein
MKYHHVILSVMNPGELICMRQALARFFMLELKASIIYYLSLMLLYICQSFLL